MATIADLQNQTIIKQASCLNASRFCRSVSHPTWLLHLLIYLYMHVGCSSSDIYIVFQQWQLCETGELDGFKTRISYNKLSDLVTSPSPMKAHTCLLPVPRALGSCKLHIHTLCNSQNWNLLSYICKLTYFFMCMSVMPACAYVYQMHAYCPWKYKEGVGSSEIGVT